MIKKEEIIIGNKEEVADYFYKLSESCSSCCNTSGSVLYTKEGFEQQIDEISKIDKNGMGIIFYMVRKESGEEIHLELKSAYYRVKNV